MILDITVDTINNQLHLLDHYRLGKTVVGTYDDSRLPNDNEIVIIIGDYPVGEQSLVKNNPIRLNYRWSLDIKYDKFEGDKAWNKLDTVYIINSDDRPDRLFEMLKEMRRANIPLNKVYRQPAIFCNKTGNYYIDGNAGCSMAHIEILKRIINNVERHSLIFEDDFTFSDPIQKNISQVDEFFKRCYDYDVLLFATSAIGEIKPLDDILSFSHQPCTTMSGYTISLRGAIKILPLFEESLAKLIETWDFNTYSCDRYWSKIQEDRKMFVLNNKMGYQRPAYSHTSKQIIYNLD
jgi:GR25 family glycosyltransferase involved in LPS biosynthesis